MRYLGAIFTILCLAACQKLEISPVPAQPSGVLQFVNYSDSDGVALREIYDTIGNEPDNAKDVVFQTTPNGRVGYRADWRRFFYYPGPGYLMGDSVLVTEQGRLIAEYSIYPALEHKLFLRQQTPAVCPVGGSVTVDFSRLHYPSSTITPYRLSVMKQPRLGQVTVEGEKVTYASQAAAGEDTVVLKIAGKMPLAFRVLVGTSAEQACLDKLELRDDTFSFTALGARNYNGYFYGDRLTVDLLMANDTYCPGYLDLTTFQVLKEDNTNLEYYDSTYSTYQSHPVMRFNQPRFLARLFPVSLRQPGRLKYRVSTVGGVRREAIVTLLP